VGTGDREEYRGSISTLLLFLQAKQIFSCRFIFGLTELRESVLEKTKFDAKNKTAGA
jgi:hypothetical protein